MVDLFDGRPGLGIDLDGKIGPAEIQIGAAGVGGRPVAADEEHGLSPVLPVLAEGDLGPLVQKEDVLVGQVVQIIQGHLLVEIADALFIQMLLGEAVEEGRLRPVHGDGRRDLEPEAREDAPRFRGFLFGQKSHEIGSFPEAEEPAAVMGLPADPDLLTVLVAREDAVGVGRGGHVVDFGDQGGVGRV